ncbi:MAG: CDP-diacylglycerol--serine O-phosphatidyltransferase [bacterium]|nr:CDP-diacylglycerol--serine O-phosphatidyltransferase [bacterium]
MKKYIPNILTFLNLGFGVLSILEVINNNYIGAAAFIIAAAIVDRYDGRIARALNVSSEIGKELDSLADLVSFGVAPAILMLFKFGLNANLIGVAAMLFYILCGCYRLAKYNITVFDGVFSGVPITICGCVLAVISLVNISFKAIPLACLVILGYLMVSKIKIQKV